MASLESRHSNLKRARKHFNQTNSQKEILDLHKLKVLVKAGVLQKIARVLNRLVADVNEAKVFEARQTLHQGKMESGA